MVKVKIRSSNVKNHPYADFIGLLTPKLLKDMNIHPPHYVRINKVISHQNKQKNLEINVLVVSSESEISNLSSLCKDPLRDDEIGLDQTYRESLDVQIGEEIEIINTDQKLVEIAPESFNNPENEKIKFSEDVLNTRNYYAHGLDYLKEQAITNSSELFFLVQQMKILFECILLHELPFSNEQIQKMMEKNRKTRNYAKDHS